MKLLIFLSLFIAIVNSMVIDKKRNQSSIHKREKYANFVVKENITIFTEGDDYWNSDWVEDSWGVDRNENKIINNVIEVNMPTNAGFTLINDELESNYGILTFEFKITSDFPGPYKLNLLAYSIDDLYKYYVISDSISYSGDDYMTVSLPIKDGKNYITHVGRFAWQNSEKEKDYKLFLRRIEYQNMEVEYTRYGVPNPIIDEKKCQLNKYWVEESDSKNRISFNKVDGKCIMKIKASESDPARLKMRNKNQQYYGGKLEITAKSNSVNKILSWGLFNPTTLESVDIKKFSLTDEYETYTTDVYESPEDTIIYTELRFTTSGEEIECDIESINFYPIEVNENTPLYETTDLNEPLVIIDKNGFSYEWNQESWGVTKAEFNNIENEMEIEYSDQPNVWPGFAFATYSKTLDAGTLVIFMRAEYAKYINVIYYGPSDKEKYYPAEEQIMTSTEYKEYRIKIPHNPDDPTYKYVIQEASQSYNKLYIKNILYYPPNINLPKDPIFTATPSSKPKPDDKPTTETDDYDTGDSYEYCSDGINLVYAKYNTLWGLENDKWCEISYKNNNCWSAIYGYTCCSSDAIPTENSAWGIEIDSSTCGFKNACWSRSLGYDCCSFGKSEEGIVFVDKDGAWGVYDNKWCGIV